MFSQIPRLLRAFVAERDLAHPSRTDLSVLSATINGHGEAAAEACTATTAHHEADKTTGEQYIHDFTHAGCSTHGDGAAGHE